MPAAAEENAVEETAQSAATEQSAPEETEYPAREPVAEISRARLSAMPLLGTSRDGEDGEGGNVALEELLLGSPKTKEVEILLMVTVEAVPGAGEDFKLEKNGQASARVELTPVPSGLTVAKSMDKISQDIFWIDNEDEEGKRPEEGALPPHQLKFRIVETDEQGEILEGGSKTDFVYAEVPTNYELLGLMEAPKASINSSGPGQSVLTITGTYEDAEGEPVSGLPTQMIHVDDEYGDTRYFKVEWELKPKEPKEQEDGNWSFYDRIEIQEP